MTLQFSIIGYFIMAVFYSISAGLLAMIWRSVRRRPEGKFFIALLTLIILILPWADEVWIAWHFHELCKDAGVHVYKKVEVEGFFNDIMSASPELIEKQGYKYSESNSREAKGKIAHVEKIADQWKWTLLDYPTSRYIYKYSANNEDVGFQLQKEEWVITDLETGEILGRDTTYKRYPGWIEGMWVRFLGVYPTICMGSAPKPPELRHLLYHYVLIPERVQ